MVTEEKIEFWRDKIDLGFSRTMIFLASRGGPEIFLEDFFSTHFHAGEGGLEVLQMMAVGTRKHLSMANQSADVIHAGTSEGRAEAVDLSIGSGLKVQKVIAGIESMVDEGLEAVVVLLLTSVDPPTVAGGDQLVGIQRRAGEISVLTDKLAFLSAISEGFANVLDEIPALFAAPKSKCCNNSNSILKKS